MMSSAIGSASGLDEYRAFDSQLPMPTRASGRMVPDPMTGSNRGTVHGIYDSLEFLSNRELLDYSASTNGQVRPEVRRRQQRAVELLMKRKGVNNNNLPSPSASSLSSASTFDGGVMSGRPPRPNASSSFGPDDGSLLQTENNNNNNNNYGENKNNNDNERRRRKEKRREIEEDDVADGVGQFGGPNKGLKDIIENISGGCYSCRSRLPMNCNERE